MNKHQLLTLILAAGEGTRMASRLPKVLHKIAHRSMLGHVLTTISETGSDFAGVIIGPSREDVAAEARRFMPDAKIFIQQERRGTAHAVLTAQEMINGTSDVLIIYGDTPLLRPQTLQALRDEVTQRAGVAILGFHASDPTGYGRLITKNGTLKAIREEKDATEDERKITLCNAGMMALRADVALPILKSIKDNNSKNEFYLTDAVEIALQMKLTAAIHIAEEQEVLGVNTRQQLAEAEHVLQTRLRKAAMASGATLIAPETVFLASDTHVGQDVILHPNIIIGPGVDIGDNVEIKPFSHIEHASIAQGATIGPFARLRPGAVIEKEAHIGNFVEIKAATIEAGAKVNHLSYIGDATIGTKANIGAGTITCNYDGYSKHRTEIGAEAFIGSNTSLVAPISIGKGAYIGSGSVITQSIPANGLAIGRARQIIMEGRAAALRERLEADKKNKE